MIGRDTAIARCDQFGNKIAIKIAPRWHAVHEQHHGRICRPFVKIVHPQISPLVEMGRKIVVGKIVEIRVGGTAKISHSALLLGY